MKHIVDFGDIVILKKKDFIDRVREVRPEEVENLESKFFHIDSFKYHFEKNDLGQIDIMEYSLDSKGEILEIKSEKNNNFPPQNISNTSVFHLLSLGLASIVKSEDTFQPNDINTPIHLNEKIKLSDGDLFYVPLKDFYSCIDKNKNTVDEYRNLIKNIVGTDLKSVLLSFNYEDERLDVSYPQRRNYKYESKVNPYADMVVDLYIGDEKLSFFAGFPSYKNDIEKMKKGFDIDKENYALMVEDFKNNKDENFEKSQGFITRVNFYDNCSEMFQRINGNIINFFKEDPAFLEKLKFIGNYRDKERMFLNSHKLIEVAEEFSIKLKKEKSKKNKPGF